MPRVGDGALLGRVGCRVVDSAAGRRRLWLRLFVAQVVMVAVG